MIENVTILNLPWLLLRSDRQSCHTVSSGNTLTSFCGLETIRIQGNQPLFHRMIDRLTRLISTMLQFVSDRLSWIKSREKL
jgi:hypothetical protein